MGGQGSLYVLCVVAGLGALGGLGETDPLTLAALQIHDVHHLEPGPEDGRHLHVPHGVGQLPAHLLIHVLKRQDRVVAGLGTLAEVGGHGDVAVVLRAAPLAQELRLLPPLVPGAAQALQGEAALKFRLIGPVEAVLDMKAHQLTPGQGQGGHALPHLAVHPDGVCGAVVEINGVDTEIPLPQGADQLLAAHAAPLPLQALPEHIVDVLDAEDGVADLTAGQVWDHLHQVPAVPAVRAAAVDEMEGLPAGPGQSAQVVGLDKGGKALHVLRVDGAGPGELLQLTGETALARLPALGVRLEHVADVLGQIHPQNFPVGAAGVVRPGRHGDDKGGDAVLPQNPGGGHVHHPAVAGVIADGPALPAALDGQQGAAVAGAGPDLVTGVPQADLRGDLTDLLVKVEDPAILLTDDVYAGVRQGAQYIFVISALHKPSLPIFRGKSPPGVTGNAAQIHTIYST